jgi:hypothetical protein
VALHGSTLPRSAGRNILWLRHGAVLGRAAGELVLETVEDERIFGIIERMAYCVADGLEQHHYDNGFVRSAKDLPDLSRTDLEQLTVEINAIMRQRLT